MTTSTARRPVTLDSLEQLDFGKGDGLMPAVVQDAHSGAVLMLGYMNREALVATLERGRVVFYSRSKRRLWEKGESSGNFLALTGIHTDCDADALLVSARAHGPTCHRGTRSCFGEGEFSHAEAVAFLPELERVIAERWSADPQASYTARLAVEGPLRIAQKVGEEGLELALAAAAQTNERVTAEAADLLYHLLVLLRSRGLSLADVIGELAARHAPLP